MLNKRILFVILFLGFVLIPFTFAQDNLTSLNADDSSISLSEDNSYLNYIDAYAAGEDSSISSSEDTSNVNIYFNASVASDGNGSKENPYKYLNPGRIAQNSTVYLADGVYELDKTITTSSNNSFIGQSRENTIIKYTNVDRLFNNNGILELNNLTLIGGSVYNKMTLNIDNVIFKDSYDKLLGGSIYSYVADLTILNSDFYNNSANFGGAIYSLDSNINISNSKFFNNSAVLGGAICDLISKISMINATFYDNSAIYQGGAIYKMYGTLNLTSSKLFNNSAKEAGAILEDYSSFNMTNNVFTNNDVYSIVNDQENFDNNTFIRSELIQQDFYNINFEQLNYTPMIYTPYNGTLPSRYDLRDYGLVTPVKNQGDDGNCWAFAALSALESCILKATGIEYDFSEENMKNLMAIFSDYGWNIMTNTGGYDMMPVGYLASWLGPVNESDDKYYETTLLSPVIESIMHVQNVLFLPRYNYTDNYRIKQAILDYGGVFTTIYAAYTYNSYQYYSGRSSPNHAVTIVGWDDNISRNKFRTAPPGDGAWICKNSWGNDWGDGGYFYVSYYDRSCARVGDSYASYTFILNDTVKYDKNYQYDVVGMTDFLLTNQSNIWYQNIFNATSDDIIAAFSTYFSYDSNFTVEVYVNNELKHTQYGSSLASYFTFNFDEFIPIYKNDIFKIVLKVTSSNEAWVPISEKVSSTRTHYKPNISFISYDGLNWIDLYNYTLNLSSRGHHYDSQVACIKAFTIFNLTTTIALSEVSIYKNNVNLTATVLDEYGHLINEGNVIFEYGGVKYNKSVNNGIATLSLNNLRYGSNNVTARYEGNLHYLPSNGDLTFYIPKNAVNLTFNVDDIYLDDYFKVNISLKDIEGNSIDSSLVLTIGDKHYIANSNSVFNVPDRFSSGKYLVSVAFNETDEYHSSEAYCNVTVNKYDVNLDIIGNNIDYGNHLTFKALLSSNSTLINENVILTINNKRFAFKANSNFILPDILDASYYNVNVFFNGNERYNSKNASINVNVNKINPKIDFNINNIKFGENAIVEVRLTDLNSNPINEYVVLTVDNKKYTFKANNKYTLPAFLNASTYGANILFNGNKNYNNISKTVQFVVYKDNLNISLSVSNATYGEKIIANNNLVDLNGNLVNENLKLEINNRVYSIRSNSEFVLPDILDASSYSANLYFEGSNNYNKCNTSASFMVSKSTPELTLDIKNITYGNYFVVENTLDTGFSYNLNLKINDKVFTVKSNSTYEIPVLFNAGNYDAVLTFDGDNNYNKVIKKVNVNVDKINPKLHLDVSDTLYTKDIFINNYLTGIDGNNIDETLSLIINNKKYSINSNNAFVLPDKLDVGSYDVNLIFNGNTNYNKANDSLTFNIYLNELNIDVNVVKNVNNVNISVKLSQKLNESINVRINDQYYPIKTVNGEATLILNNLELGQYSLEVLFNKTTYKPVLIKDKFNVDTTNTVINVKDVVMYYHDGTRLTGRFTDSNNNNLANKTIKISINGVTYSKTTDKNGIFSLNLGLNSGKYLTNIEFIGDNVYMTSSNEILVNIKPTFDLHNLTKYYRNSSQFHAKIYDFDGNPAANVQVIMNINGVFYNRTTDSNGVVRLNINLIPNKYILTVYNPVTGEQASCEVNVLSRLVENHDLVKYYRNASKYSVKVLDEKGSPLVGVDVTFNINGVFYTRTTDSNGVASLAINLIPGSYVITAKYDSQMVSNEINVLSVIKSNNLVMNYKDGSKFKVLVLDNQGNPYPNQNVVFNINGVFYTRATDSTGYSNLNINLMEGKYIITSTFNELSVSNTITIK